MPNIRNFKVSDELFQGFEIALDLDYYDSNEEICKQMQQSLIGFLENHSFEILTLRAKNLQLHIHDIEFGTILISEPDTEFWVCSHCTNEESDDVEASGAAENEAAPSAAL